jgi:hypothetical protein
MKIIVHIEPESAGQGRGLTPGTESFDEAFAAPLQPLEPSYGIGISDLLRFIPLDGLLSGLLVALVSSQEGRIAEGADRLMTPSANAIRAICRTLKIEREDSIDKIIALARSWGNIGGDLLTEIVKAKAGG